MTQYTEQDEINEKSGKILQISLKEAKEIRSLRQHRTKDLRQKTIY